MPACQIGFNPCYHAQAPSIEALEELTGYALLEFGDNSCGHCQAASAIVAKAFDQRQLPHIKVADGKGKKLGRLFKVKLWPTLILLEAGSEVGRVIRPTSAADIDTLLSLIQR